MQALWVFDPGHLAQTCLMQLSACQAIHKRPKLVHESEIDLSQKWSEYERLNANWDRSKLVWTLHVSKQTEIDLRSINIDGSRRLFERKYGY